MNFYRRLWLDILASLKARLFPESRAKRRRARPRRVEPWRIRLGSGRAFAFEGLEPRHLLSTVTIAETANANALTGAHGTFTLTASPAPTMNIAISYSESGTAQPGVTYQQLSNTVTLAADATTTTIDVAPISNSSEGTSPTLTVTLTSAQGQTIGSPNSASMTITEPAQTPTVSSLTPTSGNANGGTTVSISGAHFTGATAVTFGGTAATSYTVISDNSITAVSPAHSAGVVDVEVTNSGGTSAANSGDRFTYNAPAPTVTAVSPSAGGTAGGASVTISGTNLSGATEVDFGGVPASSFTVQSSTSITATSPAEAAATVDVTVHTAGGASATSSADKFTYLGAPTITSVTPNSGVTSGGTSVSIVGSNLTQATAVSFDGIAASSFTVLSSTQISAVSPAHTVAGTVDVTVTTPGGTSTTSAADQFTYTVPPPTVAAVSPNSGPSAGGTTVTITGQNFVATTGVSFGGVAASFTVDTPTSITATSPAHDPAAVDIVVTTATGTSPSDLALDGFTYIAPGRPA